MGSCMKETLTLCSMAIGNTVSCVQRLTRLKAAPQKFNETLLQNVFWACPKAGKNRGDGEGHNSPPSFHRTHIYNLTMRPCGAATPRVALQESTIKSAFSTTMQ